MKTSFYKIVFHALVAIVLSNKAISSGPTQEIIDLSKKTQTNYNQLVQLEAFIVGAGIAEPLYEGSPQAHWLGQTIKEELGLNNQTAEQNGLIHFYQKFLTTDRFVPGESNLTDAKLLDIARLQATFSDPSKNYPETSFAKEKLKPHHHGVLLNGFILVDSYRPVGGNPFDVTVYSFFVGALKTIQNFKNLSSNDLKRIKLNLDGLNRNIEQLLKDELAIIQS